MQFIEDYQYGFRAKLIAIDQAARLITSLQQAKAKHMNASVLFLSIKKAFDRVDHHSLILDLLSVGLPIHLIRLIYTIMHHNQIHVSLNGYLSQPYHPEDGVPQGGILCPLLFIFYIRDLPTRHASPFAFADDVALSMITFHNVNPAPLLSQDYALIRKYFAERRIQLSDTKIQVLHLSNRV